MLNNEGSFTLWQCGRFVETEDNYQEIKLTQNVYKFKGFGRDTGGTLDS